MWLLPGSFDQDMVTWGTMVTCLLLGAVESPSLPTTTGDITTTHPGHLGNNLRSYVILENNL